MAKKRKSCFVPLTKDELRHRKLFRLGRDLCYDVLIDGGHVQKIIKTCKNPMEVQYVLRNLDRFMDIVCSIKFNAKRFRLTKGE